MPIPPEKIAEAVALYDALHVERFDPYREEVTICGVRYSIGLFAGLGIAPVGDWVRMEKREGETLTLRLASAADWPSEREEMLSLLREVEWSGQWGAIREPTTPACWWCDRTKDERHSPGCRLAAFLGP